MISYYPILCVYMQQIIQVDFNGVQILNKLGFISSDFLGVWNKRACNSQSHPSDIKILIVAKNKLCLSSVYLKACTEIAIFRLQ